MELDGYRIEGEIARGGMGLVYRALDAASGRRVALKLLLDTNERFRERFRREAELLGRLQHTNVVTVHDAGEAKGRPYLVMEFVEGETLADRLRRTGPLTPSDAVGLVASVARGAGHAHAKGLVHRDIKPDNVLIRPNGAVVLTDFGLARDVEVRSELSKTGVFLGTPGYASPEQAAGEGKRVGPPSDVYGLGALLFELIAGEPPAVGTLLQILVATISAPAPSLRAHAPRADVDATLDAICRRCLEKDPAARFESGDALAEALEAYGRGERSEGSLPSTRRGLAVAALVGVAALGVAALLGRGPLGSSPAPPSPTPLARSSPPPAQAAEPFAGLAAPEGLDAPSFQKLSSEIATAPLTSEVVALAYRGVGERADMLKVVVAARLGDRDPLALRGISVSARRWRNLERLGEALPLPQAYLTHDPGIRLKLDAYSRAVRDLGQDPRPKGSTEAFLLGRALERLAEVLILCQTANHWLAGERRTEEHFDFPGLSDLARSLEGTARGGALRELALLIATPEGRAAVASDPDAHRDLLERLVREHALRPLSPTLRFALRWLGLCVEPNAEAALALHAADGMAAAQEVALLSLAAFSHVHLAVIRRLHAWAWRLAPGLERDKVLQRSGKLLAGMRTSRHVVFAQAVRAILLGDKEDAALCIRGLKGVAKGHPAQEEIDWLLKALYLSRWGNRSERRLSISAFANQQPRPSRYESAAVRLHLTVLDGRPSERAAAQRAYDEVLAAKPIRLGVPWLAPSEIKATFARGREWWDQSARSLPR